MLSGVIIELDFKVNLWDLILEKQVVSNLERISFIALNVYHITFKLENDNAYDIIICTTL